MVQTPNRSYVEPLVGGNVGTWGTLLNQNFLAIDANVSGFVAIPVSGNTNYNASTTQTENLILQLTGVLTGNIQFIMPALGGFWFIDNETTGAYTITVVTSASGSTGVIAPQGSPINVYSDGTNIHAGSVIALQTGTGLTGGPIYGVGTISLAPVANGYVIANTTGMTGAPSGVSLSSLLDSVLGSTVGSITYRGSTGWTTLGPGATGQLLETQGTLLPPIWTSIAAIPATGVLADLANTMFVAGNMIYYNGTNMVPISPGSAGQILIYGSGNTPAWGSPSIAVPDYINQSLGIF